MSLLIAAVAVFLLGGLLALSASRWPLLSTILGVAAAVAGGSLGLVPALGSLLRGTTERFQRPWDVPFGSLFLELDPLSALFLIPVLGLSALAAIQGGAYLWKCRERVALGPAWFFYNVLSSGMVVVVLARNGVLFLVAWEVMSLASYFLVTLEHERSEAREVGRIYLIATHLGTAFLLVYFVLLSDHSGTLDFAVGGASTATIAPSAANLLFLLALVGFGTKAGFMPLHTWLPGAYPVAPGFVAALMSGAMSKLGIYGLIRTLSLLPASPAWWGWMLIGVGVLSGLGGIIASLAQSDLKRLLAYSSVENVGIIALGLGIGLLGTSSGRLPMALLGYSGSLLHVINHSMYKGLLFLGSGVVEQATGTRELDRLGGLARRMPAAAIAFLVGSVAIVGLPPLNGFLSEFLIYRGAFEEEMLLGTSWAVPALGVIGALAMIGGLAAVAFTKLFGIAFLGEPRSPRAAEAERPGWLLTVSMYVLSACCVLVGLMPTPVASALVPAVAVAARLDAAKVAPDAAVAVAPLSTIALASWVVIGVSLILAAIRAALLTGREVGQSVTWGCGYTRPTSRMQYTSSSYVQPAVTFFKAIVRPRVRLVPPQGLFPRESALATEVPDLVQETFYRPVFRSIDWMLSRLRWLQHGNLYLYVLYIGATALILLIWYLGIARG